MTLLLAMVTQAVALGDKAAIMADGLDWSGIFHGIGARLLRECAIELGLDPRLPIHDREVSADLMKLARHDLRFSKTANRFPAKGTCLSIYLHTVDAEAPFAAILRADFPWCAVWCSAPILWTAR